MKPNIINGYKSSEILLNTGNRFNFDDIQSNVVSIVDIANGLAGSNRFNGQTNLNRLVTVAEHSVRVSRKLPKIFAYTGLMHDSAEAIMGDMVTPLKRKIPEFKKYEVEIESFLAELFHFNYPFDSLIKEVDVRMFATEFKQAFDEDVQRDLAYESYDDVVVEFWSPIVARDMFLQEYFKLREEGAA